MPSVHKFRAITPRPPDDVREAAQDASRRKGTSLNQEIIGFLRWFGGLTDKLPERPPRPSPSPPPEDSTADKP